jgi:hypothetical protein
MTAIAARTSRSQQFQRRRSKTLPVAVRITFDERQAIVCEGDLPHATVRTIETREADQPSTEATRFRPRGFCRAVKSTQGTHGIMAKKSVSGKRSTTVPNWIAKYSQYKRRRTF